MSSGSSRVSNTRGQEMNHEHAISALLGAKGGDKFMELVQAFVMAEPPIARDYCNRMAKTVGISLKDLAGQFAAMISVQSVGFGSGSIPLQKLLMTAAYPVPILVAKAQATEEKGAALCKEEKEFRQLIAVAWLDGFESVLHGRGQQGSAQGRTPNISFSQRAEVVNALLKTDFVKDLVDQMVPEHPRNAVLILRTIMSLASFPLDPSADARTTNRMLDKETCLAILKNKAAAEGLLTFAISNLAPKNARTELEVAASRAREVFANLMTAGGEHASHKADIHSTATQKITFNFDAVLPGIDGRPKACPEILVTPDWKDKMAALSTAFTTPQTPAQQSYEEQMLAQMFSISCLGITFTGKRLTHCTAVEVQRRCGACGKPGALQKLHACTGCHSAWYCGRVCQRADWKTHKPACKKASS